MAGSISSPRSRASGRLVVQHDVVERVGQDLGEPDQPGLHAADEEQVDGAEQQRAGGEADPEHRQVLQEAAEIGVRLLEQAEHRRREESTSGASAQMVCRITLRRRL